MADKINYTPTPKQQFLEQTKQVAEHRNLMQNSSLRMSFNMALLQYQHNLMAGMSDASGAAASSFKLKGAAEFLNTLIMLGEQMPQVDPSKIEQLNHQV